MDEKKVTKISLSTFFLILAVIAIVIMGVLIYKINNDKIAETNKSNELQTKVNSLEGKANELQVKINTVSQTVNSNNTENTVSNTTVTNTEVKKYTYSDIAGTYKGTSKNNDESNDGYSDRHYELNLFENGTFSYENYSDTPNGKIGNYTIVDDTITLNYWFSTGSDTSLDVANGKKTLKLNENNSITDSQPERSNSSNLVLTKVPSTEENEKATTINYIIDNYCIYNKFEK